MLLIVKARVRRETIPELGRKLASGELGPSPVKWTFCLEDDPAVGVTLWEVEDLAAFQARFEKLRPYYAELIEVRPVLTAQEAMKRLV